jgi:Ribosomal protein L11 methyltransferase (PrmA)
VSKLDRTTALRRAPSLRIETDANNDVRILKGGISVKCDAHGLAVLDVFSRYTTLGDALDTLDSRIVGAVDWIDLIDTIVTLYDAGILETDGAGGLPKTPPVAFGSPHIHIRMLNDRDRTDSFMHGVREVVREGDVVVDIGTGTGILAVTAVQCGARHVYAIEASAISSAARAVIEANGMSDRISLIEGWSTRVSLPEKADVLVSELMGADPLTENILEITMDAVQRFLKKGASIVPQRLRIYGVPVNIPARELSEHLFTEDSAENWERWYRIRFSALAQLQTQMPASFFVRPSDILHWRAFAPAVMLAHIDLTCFAETVISSRVAVMASEPGLCNGIVLYFELDVGGDYHLSTAREKVKTSNHWGNRVFCTPNAIEMNAGDSLQLSYEYALGRSWLEIRKGS